MKAFRTVDGEVVTFRPDQNAARFAEGAGRMSMLPVPEEIFVDAVKKCISANRDFIPPEGKGSVVSPPASHRHRSHPRSRSRALVHLPVYCSPVASYFKAGSSTPIDLVVEESYHRAAPGGTGSTKCIGNYSPF